MIHAQMISPASTAVHEGFSSELRAFWRHFPDKPFFFGLLAAWLALFHLIGNATFGYIYTPFLFRWMAEVYGIKDPQGHPGEDSFCFVIFPLVVGLIWVKRKDLLDKPLRTWWPGIWLVTAGLFFHIIGYILQQPRASI